MNSKFIVIKLIKSFSKSNKRISCTLKNLGLKKIDSFSIIKNTDSNLGMIYKIQNYIKVLFLK